MNEPRDTVLNKIDTWKHSLISLMCWMLKKVKLKYGDWDESVSEGGLGKRLKCVEYVWWTNLEI